MRNLILIALSLLFSANLYAQVCLPTKTPLNISSGNFDLTQGNPAGAEIFDKISGLTWSRCVYGQTWSGTKCEGTPVKLTWQQALLAARDFGWRVPNFKELSLILDFQCIGPPLNNTMFPDFPASRGNGLWTSTPHVIATNSVTHAFWVEMMFGNLTYRMVNEKNFVLFVK